jgi:ribosomal protein S18 acetylase RimI-like enzyme
MNEVDALEENLWSQWSQFGRPPTCSFHRDDKICQLDTPIASLPYNGVFKFSVDAAPEDRIDAIIDHYKRRSVEHLWLVHPTARPQNLDMLLEARGLKQVETFSGMVVEPSGLKADQRAPQEFEFRRIEPTEEDVVIEMVAKRWSVPTDAIPHLRSFFRSNRVGAPDAPMQGWLATINGRAVGKGFTYRSRNIVGLYGVATQPEARGKGIGTALCVHALRQACSSDVDLLVLHSTPMAHSLYRSLGFRDVAPFGLFTRDGGAL